MRTENVRGKVYYKDGLHTKKKLEITELQFQPAAVILQMLFDIATKRFRISGLFCSFIVGIMVFDATVF